MITYNEMKFAENFSALLKDKGFSQLQFAKLLGVKSNTVNQWANGKREPSFHNLLCICTFLNVDLNDLFGFTGDIITGNIARFFTVKENMGIKEFRAKIGMTQTEFGNWLRIPMRTIQNWESGQRTPPQYVLDLIAFKVDFYFNSLKNKS